jgi:hypothetical protein
LLPAPIHVYSFAPILESDYLDCHPFGEWQAEKRLRNRVGRGTSQDPVGLALPAQVVHR